ncbi:hypothetical protein PF003_g21381 [Phytophthora fragariae]|nr:hypothetical protein PF003_g21381 [Phytophthora fragariae]
MLMATLLMWAAHFVVPDIKGRECVSFQADQDLFAPGAHSNYSSYAFPFQVIESCRCSPTELLPLS